MTEDQDDVPTLDESPSIELEIERLKQRVRALEARDEDRTSHVHVHVAHQPAWKHSIPPAIRRSGPGALGGTLAATVIAVLYELLQRWG